MFDQQRNFFKENKYIEKFQRRIDFMKDNYKKVLKSFGFVDASGFKVLPYMVFNKVMISRYRKVEISLISISELDDIIKRSRVTVIMFDEYQVLTAEEYWEPAVLDHFKELSYRQGNLLGLSQQLRMQCSDTTMKWINSFVEFRVLLRFTKDSQYDVRSFDSPKELHNAIKARASVDSLSRFVHKSALISPPNLIATSEYVNVTGSPHSIVIESK